MISITPKDIEVLSERILETRGYDFRGYAQASFERRLRSVLLKLRCPNIDALSDKVLGDSKSFEDFLSALSVPVTEMFRDSVFFRALREQVIPLLRTYPFFNIWHAGCATGEEVYSMAILLQEAGLLKRATLYATDFNPVALARAKAGLISPMNFQKAVANYRLSGGLGNLSLFGEYKGTDFHFNESLKKKMTFSHHNMVQDKSFGSMNLILCRNVMIYFNAGLQVRVLKLFDESLVNCGIICVGAQETLEFADQDRHFEPWLHKEKIYKKRPRLLS